MGILVANSNRSVGWSLTALKLAGYWAPAGLAPRCQLAYRCYTVVSFMFLLGTYLVTQVVDLFLAWGDLAAMTGTAFLLFTNLAQSCKMANLVLRRDEVGRIVRETDEMLRAARGDEAREVVRRCDSETARDHLMYFMMTTTVVSGWACSAEPHHLPLQAWYPYDTSASPAYELTYAHQILAIFIAAYLNIAKDMVVVSLVGQTRCRLQLLRLALRDVTAHAEREGYSNSSLLDESADLEARRRLRACVVHHQAALTAASDIEKCFSAPTFAQLTVSLIIICVTAFQMASMSGNLVRAISMATYLFNMSFQVFLYCRYGNDLREEGVELVTAAYECCWYRCSTAFRSTLLVLTRRCFRPLRLTVGGFTTLSLQTFMAIIKASYSFFTLLQQVNEKQ